MTVKPLAGVKVLELARILAGPWVGQTLADLGADVVKVERPGAGDDTRGLGAALRGRAPTARHSRLPISTPATAASARSPSISRRTEGQELVRRLAAHADIVIENFKVGGLAKYGLDSREPAALSTRGSSICSITGFGQDGPYARRAPATTS